jgi:hypothetical protein
MDYFLITIVGLAVLLALFVFVASRRKGFFSADQEMFRSHWKALQHHIADHPSQAILDADKLLDLALKKRGYVGSVGDKLKSAKVMFSDLDGIWSAHKLRNKVAHEVGFEPSEKQADAALSQFKQGLVDLGVSL